MLVHWERSGARSGTHFRKKAGLFMSQLDRASLAGQPETIKYIERPFEVELTR